MAFLNLLYNNAQSGMADSRVNKLMDDREHDWLARQLAEERAAKYRMCDMFDMKKNFGSAPVAVGAQNTVNKAFNVARPGAASLAKAVHAANCDATAIRNAHAAECDAEGIDTAQGR